MVDLSQLKFTCICNKVVEYKYRQNHYESIKHQNYIVDKKLEKNLAEKLLLEEIKKYCDKFDVNF